MKRELFNYQWNQTHIQNINDKWYIVWPDGDIAYEISYKKISDANTKRNNLIEDMQKILNNGIKK